MRRIWTLAASVAAAFALTGLSGTAFAEVEYPMTGLPELGRCVNIGSGGVYRGKGCVELAPNHNGAYEWKPGPGAKGTFQAVGISEATLQTVGGKKIRCGPSEITGQWLESKKANVSLAFHGCVDGQKRPCTTPEVGLQKESEIKTEGPLEGEIGFISGKGTKTPKVGIDLKSGGASPMLTFTCQKPTNPGPPPEIDPEPTTWTVEGSLIGTWKPVDKMKTESKGIIRAVAGKQVPEKFEEGVKDVPIANYGSPVPSTKEEAGLTLIEEFPRKWFLIESGEPLEIKAK
jgi:hypothetical protein